MIHPAHDIAITHTSRTGKTYYLHTGPRRGGGIQHFFSTQFSGSLAEKLPEGFEIHESVHGQVFLRRQRPRLIRDEETACIESRLASRPGGNLYKVEVRDRADASKLGRRAGVRGRRDPNWH